MNSLNFYGKHRRKWMGNLEETQPRWWSAAIPPREAQHKRRSAASPDGDAAQAAVGSYFDRASGWHTPPRTD